jgi:hypothetical protein
MTSWATSVGGSQWNWLLRFENRFALRPEPPATKILTIVACAKILGSTERMMSINQEIDTVYSVSEKWEYLVFIVQWC